VVGRCSSAGDAFTHASSLRVHPVLVDDALSLEGSPNLVVAHIFPGACCSRRLTAWSPGRGRRTRRCRAGPRAERRVLARLDKG
jgi:hypothetical protein